MKLKILVPKIKPPTSNDILTRQLKSIFDALGDYFEIEVCWVVFQPYKFDSKDFENGKMINYCDYKNAVDVIDEIKPDLIFLEVIMGIGNMAFIHAGKFCNIPIVTITTSGKIKPTSRYVAITNTLRVIFSNKVLGDMSHQNKRFSMLKFSLQRYRFLLNTLKKTKQNVVKFILFYPGIQILSRDFFTAHKIMQGDLNICCNKNYYNKLKDAGFDEAKLIMEGDPVFDFLYEKTTVQTKNEKIRVLFCPTPMHEHGWMSKKKEFELISHIIKNIIKELDMELLLKIHPSSTDRTQYEKLLQKLNLKIPLYQKEDTIDLIRSSNVILNYGSSTVILDSILCKKPVVLITTGIMKDMDRLYDSTIMNECENLKDLSKIIRDVTRKKISEIEYIRYVEEQIGVFDGKCSRRIAKQIYEIFQS